MIAVLLYAFLRLTCGADCDLAMPVTVLTSHCTLPQVAFKFTSIGVSTVLEGPFSAPSDAIPLAIDLLNSEFLSLWAQNSLNGTCLVNGNEYEVYGERKLWLGLSRELRMLQHIAQWLKIQSLFAFLDDSRTAAEVSSAFQSLRTRVTVLNTDTSSSAVAEIVRRQVKPGNYPAVLLALSPAATLQVLEVLKDTHFPPVFFLTSSAALYRFLASPAEYIQRGIFLSISGCENATSAYDSVSCELNATLSPSPAFARVMTIQQGVTTAAGKVTDEGLLDMAVFQGPTNASALFSHIQFSINNGVENPHSENTSEVLSEYEGARLAVMSVNKHPSVLPYQILEMRSLSLGATEFDWQWTRDRLLSGGLESIGIAMIAGGFSSVAMGVYEVLEALGWSLPQVGAANTAPQLSSLKAFRLFTRVTMSDAYIAVIYGHMIQQYGWKQICVVYQNDIWSETMYELIVSEARVLGVHISNREALRQLDPSNSTQFAAVYEEVIATKVKILILILYGESLSKSIETLYDLGMRGGDLVFLAIGWLVPSFFHQESESLSAKIKELCTGAVMFYPASYVGSVGAQTASDYRFSFHREPPMYACYFYDAVWMLAHALDYLIQTGRPYDSSAVLNRALKNSRFVGCTGLVTIDGGTNDRAPSLYSIANARVMEDGNVELRQVGTYDPTAIVLFHFETPILWPGNTTTTPSDVRENLPGCPFQAKQVNVYFPAAVLSYSLMVGLCIIFISFNLLLWRKLWNQGPKRLTQPVEASASDHFMFLKIAIEAMQYINLSPAQSFSALSALWVVGGDISNAVKFSTFWVWIDLSLVTVGLWIYLLVAAWLNANSRNRCRCDCVEEVSEAILPLLGDIAFVPLVSTLLSVLQCPKAVVTIGREETIRSAFLRWDCSVSCWTSEHLPFALTACVSLCLYVPMALSLRPAWQSLTPSLHISTAPAFLMLKSVYQLVLICFTRTLEEYKAVHSTVFIVSTLTFSGLTLRVRPYGYSRANLWHFLSLLCVLVVTVTSLAFQQLHKGAESAWLAVCLAELMALAVVGFIVQHQKLPQLLHVQPGLSVAALFRFMFSRSVDSSTVRSKVYAYSDCRVEDSLGVRRMPRSQGFSTATQQ